MRMGSRGSCTGGCIIISTVTFGRGGRPGWAAAAAGGGGVLVSRSAGLEREGAGRGGERASSCASRRSLKALSAAAQWVLSGCTRSDSRRNCFLTASCVAASAPGPMLRIARQPPAPPSAVALAWTLYAAIALSTSGSDGQSRFAFSAILCASTILPARKSSSFLPRVTHRHVGVCWIGLDWSGDGRSLLCAWPGKYIAACSSVGLRLESAFSSPRAARSSRSRVRIALETLGSAPESPRSIVLAFCLCHYIIQNYFYVRKLMNVFSKFDQNYECLTRYFYIVIFSDRSVFLSSDGVGYEQLK